MDAFILAWQKFTERFADVIKASDNDLILKATPSGVLTAFTLFKPYWSLLEEHDESALCNLIDGFVAPGAIEMIRADDRMPKLWQFVDVFLACAKELEM